MTRRRGRKPPPQGGSKVSLLTDLYLRSLETEIELHDLREQCQSQERRIQELQRLIPKLSVDPNRPGR